MQNYDQAVEHGCKNVGRSLAVIVVAALILATAVGVPGCAGSRTRPATQSLSQEDARFDPSSWFQNSKGRYIGKGVPLAPVAPNAPATPPAFDVGGAK